MIEEQQRSDNPERGTRRVPRSVIVGLVAASAVALGAAVYLGIAYRTEAEEPVVVSEEAAPAEEAAPFTPASGAVAPPEAETDPDETPEALTPPAPDEAPEDAGAGAASSDEPLPTLHQVPSDAVSMIVLPDGFESAQFQIAFSPFGWGSGGQAGRNLIVAVGAMEPIEGDVDGVEDQSGKTLSVWLAEGEGAAVPSGGEYECVLEIRKQGDLGWLFVSGISKK